MLSFLFLTSLWALSAGEEAAPRIVQGEVAQKGEVPWQLSLQLDGSHICGAVALSPNIVLTAAHCVDFAGYEPSRFRFVCGLHDVSNDVGQVGVAQKIIKHEGYNANALGFPNDIAVARVEPAFKFDELCQSAALPTSNDKTYANKASRITGWGRLYGNGPLPTYLKKAHIPTITNTECGRDYDILIFRVIRATHICVKDPTAVQGACNGDSGGPLTTPDFDTGRQKVTGITSFGRAGCDTRSASVYTRVSSYIDWIKARSSELNA